MCLEFFRTKMSAQPIGSDLKNLWVCPAETINRLLGVAHEKYLWCLLPEVWVGLIVLL
jgi:hypothetical protein